MSSNQLANDWHYYLLWLPILKYWLIFKKQLWGQRQTFTGKIRTLVVYQIINHIRPRTLKDKLSLASLYFTFSVRMSIDTCINYYICFSFYCSLVYTFISWVSSSMHNASTQYTHSENVYFYFLINLGLKTDWL